MRKVLAITVALMIAAIVLMPALGYTNQAAGNQSYTAKSEEKVGYSFTTNVPAHNLTPDMVANKYSFEASAVKSTRMPYSFKQGTAAPYSIKLEGVDNAVAEGMTAKKDIAMLGSLAKKSEEKPAVPEEIEVAPEETVTPAEPKFSIEGMVVDNNQTGLAGWTMNLTMAGAVVNSAISAVDGKFAFTDLAAGEYAVAEVLMDGWQFVDPADGIRTVNITSENVTNLVFVNQAMPAVAIPAENVTAQANNTVPAAATVQ